MMAKVRVARAGGPQKRRLGMDEATEHIESEGDRLIKQLVEKQLSTNVSLEEQLRCERQFERRLEVGALSCGAQGQTTWQQFRDWERWAELRSHGLTGNEVALLQGHKQRRLEDRVAEEQLADIRRRLEAQPDPHQSEGGAGRHERELGASVKPGSQETKLFQFALACRPVREDPRPPDHPIHSLKALEQQLFSHLVQKETVSKISKVSQHSAPSKVAPCSCADKASTKKSGWDVKCEHHAKGKQVASRVYSCKPQVQYTIRNGKIVTLEQAVAPASVTEVGRQGETFVAADTSSFQVADMGLHDRLSVEQIRNLPRFADYSAGQPSQVLFIKNIHRSMKEEDLVVVFGRFEDATGPKLTYRLMTGRMRGQAFVTFPSVEKAAVALESVNGTLWGGQPLVIQFGRHSGT